MKDQHESLIKEYQALVAEYESNDLVNEHELLKNRLEEYKVKLTALQSDSEKLRQENNELRTALAEQMLDEKLNILKVSREKLHTYFASQSKAYGDRLTAFEQMAKHRLERMYAFASRQLSEDKEEITGRLEQLSAEINQKVMLQRQMKSETENKARSEIDGGLDELAGENISEEIIRRRRLQNRIEMKIGLGWINRLGILLIILGVGAAFKYSYSNWFSGYMKGSAFFLLGALMLAGGEWLFRKGRGTFALGLLGGGISVLYGSIFYSYFLLEIISIYTGLSLSVLVTLTAVLLSLRYQSRSICSLALIGGYLPLFSYIGAFGLEGNAVFAAMGYLFLLNLSILLISLRKRWVIVNYISFLFNTPSMLLLISLSDSDFVSMLYAVTIFAMYLVITLWYPFKFRSKLSWWDFSLLGTNTLVSCVTLYVLFISSGLEEYKGGLALLFCLMYFGLGWILEKVMKQEKESILLFYSISLTFAVLMIPFQFGAVWWSMGWLVEAVVLIVYGNLNRFKGLERAGWGLLLLCLGSFFGFNVPLQADFSLLESGDRYFALKYTFITAGMLIVALLYAFRHQHKDYLVYSGPSEVKLTVLFRYAALLNLWFYLLYESRHLYELAIPEDYSHYRFYDLLLSAAVTIGMAYVLPKVRVLYDTFVKYYSLVLYVISYVICIAVTIGLPTLHLDRGANTAADYIALGILIAFNLFVLFSGRDLLKSEIRRKYKNMEFYPVILAVYLLGIITAFLSVQLRLGDVGLTFSLIYLLLAVLYIMYGFRKRYVYIRRFGLGLTLLSTGKLLLYDLSLLTSGSKIAAYFSFGVCLLGISYIYQKVSGRMGESRGGAESDQKH
ncbi:DUF2339 domain-containing protein [Paenibacillus sp. sgz500958]|uniref:DUF2339 domain-containing protein n=1 Tax=Paenibacillus sp. sgz500958 TaxID=3242475 RepID=UPI0036D242D8